MLVAIPSRVFTSRRSRVIVSGPAVAAAPPRTVSAVWSPSSPFRLNKAARRPCRAAVGPPPRPAAAPASAGRPQRRRCALGWGRRSVSRGPAALQTRTPAGVPTREAFPPVCDHLMANPTPSHAPRRRARRSSSCGAASRRTAQGLPRGSFALRVRSPSVGR